jgi:hypothetical protein
LCNPLGRRLVVVVALALIEDKFLGQPVLLAFLWEPLLTRNVQDVKRIGVNIEPS